MILKMITPPAAEPIALADVQYQCRIGDLTAEAAPVNLFISAVRARAEAITRRAFITQTLELVLDVFPDVITIPRPPLQSVISIMYLDVNAVQQTLDPSLYIVDSDSEPARIVPAYGQLWPDIQNTISTIRVRFVCGYTFPAFDPTVAYAVGQQVVYLGAIYKCKAPTTAGTLPTDATKWDAGNLADAVPPAIKQWCLMNVANLYENRETETVAAGRLTQVDLSTLADGLLNDYRIQGW
jgi:uncharacterized phiE125 gp8 family phage protein